MTNDKIEQIDCRSSSVPDVSLSYLYIIEEIFHMTEPLLHVIMAVPPTGRGWDEPTGVDRALRLELSQLRRAQIWSRHRRATPTGRGAGT